MAEPFLPTPFAEKLVAELRALHDRRERAPLDDREEARYAELWAWWQERSGGADLEDPGVAGGDAASGAIGGVPAEWHAFADQPAEGDAAADGPADDEDALVREWEAWQGRQPPGDPFAAVPGMEGGDDDVPTHEEIMAARAEALGVDATLDELGAEAAGADGEALPEIAVEVERELSPSSEAEEAPPPALAAAAAPSGQRVVIHLNDGQVRRGQLSYPRLDVDVFGFVTQSGAEETVPRAEVRAIFFMRSPGDPPPQPIGRAVRVSFRDGRELAGFSEDHDRISDAFTLVPSDARTNASLVWIARSAVRQVTAV